MRDLAFVGFLVALFAFGFRRPFMFVLAYVYIDVVSPQRLTYLLLNSIPISMLAAAAAVGGWLLADDKRNVRVAPRQFLLLLLLGWIWYTTVNADFPVDAAYKWEWVWKAMAFAIFLPLTLHTRLRIEALLLFMLLGASSIIVVGGIKTMVTGGGYGELNLMVSNNAGLYESSTISTVAVAIIPIILWFTRHGTVFPPDWRVRTYGYALIFACLLMPVGTSARTGLLCVGLLAVLMLRDIKRRLLYLVCLGLAGVAAIPLLPSSFTERMETIGTYQADASASTRLAVWAWTLDYVRDNPAGGGFEAYRQNQIRYDKVATVGEGANQTVQRELEVDKARAYHSAYFEMLGEQGYFGFGLWLLIHYGGVFRMEVLRRRYLKGPPEDAWAASLATALQHAHLIYLLGSAFVAIALNPFTFMLLGAQIGLDTYLARKRGELRWQPLRRSKPEALDDTLRPAAG